MSNKEFKIITNLVPSRCDLGPEDCLTGSYFGIVGWRWGYRTFLVAVAVDIGVDNKGLVVAAEDIRILVEDSTLLAGSIPLRTDSCRLVEVADALKIGLAIAKRRNQKQQDVLEVYWGAEGCH